MSPKIDTHHIDCLGMQCPAPILKVAKQAREVGDAPAILRVEADDCDFPTDIESWCRATNASLHSLEETEDGFCAVIGLNGAEKAEAAIGEESSEPAAAADSTEPATPADGADGVLQLDLRGRTGPQCFLELSQAALQPGVDTIALTTDAADFEPSLYNWASSVRGSIENLERTDGVLSARIEVPDDARSAEGPATPAPPKSSGNGGADDIFESLQQLDADSIPDDALQLFQSASLATTKKSDEAQNRATFLVLHNDFESLMACMLVASAAAAQGMDVVVFFSFWGVNLLRADHPRRAENGEKVSFLQSMMKWMMPKGPRRQKMSKMHMGGIGKAMMEFFMKKNNVMTLDELIESAVEQDISFMVCTMSMGIMGIQKHDIMQLPNLKYGGVTAFVENARRSEMNMVF
jgi:peroxiredoxin family protein/TusA-related sulfurtransferase